MALDWDPEGRILATGAADGSIWLWPYTHDDHSSSSSSRLGHPFLFATHEGSRVSDLAWSPSGSRIATCGGAESVVRLWPVVRGEGGSVRLGGPPRVLSGHRNAVTAVSWSPGGSRLASVGWDATLRVWGLEQEEEGEAAPLWTYPEPSGLPLMAVAWSPSGGRIAAAGFAGGVLILELHGNGTSSTTTTTTTPAAAAAAAALGFASVHEVPIGANNRIRALAWSSDGQALAAGGWDFSVRVLTAAPQGPAEEMQKGLGDPGEAAACLVAGEGPGRPGPGPWVTSNSLSRHTGKVSAAVWMPGAPGNRVLASTAMDGSVILWISKDQDQDHHLLHIRDLIEVREWGTLLQGREGG